MHCIFCGADNVVRTFSIVPTASQLQRILKNKGTLKRIVIRNLIDIQLFSIGNRLLKLSM